LRRGQRVDGRAPELDRSETCRLPPWLELARRYWDGRVEEAAIAHLHGRDLDRVSAAAQILGSFGSAQAKQPLLDRLAWEAEWRGHGADRDLLVPRPESPARIENALVNALLNNRAIEL
jgi:hypothetical protein